MKAVFDTNILIDYLNGVSAAREEFQRFQLRQISVITYIEVMVGAENSEEESLLDAFLATFEIIGVTTEIAKETISLRKRFRLKIPDAIVYATARVHGCLLVSRNTKDFQSAWPDVRVPYKL